MEEVRASNLGFPRIGSKRELKKLVEQYWTGKISAETLLNETKKLRDVHWGIQKKSLTAGLVPSNDFSLYDHVLDTSFLYGAIPDRYLQIPSELDRYFAMGRGFQRPSEGIDVPAMEMKKWFDTNYHYIVPEFSPLTTFHLDSNPKPVIEFKEALSHGIDTRPVLLGPISYLYLGKLAKDASPDFNPLSLLDKLLPVFENLLHQLFLAGMKSVQIDEPILVLDLDSSFHELYSKVYKQVHQVIPTVNVTIATYFGGLGKNLDFLLDLPIHCIHVDAVRGQAELDSVLVSIAPTKKTLSIGIVDGRNIWKNDLNKSIATIKRAVNLLGHSRVIVAPSCSLLHSPFSLDSEVKMNPSIKSWLSFAVEKIQEVHLITAAINKPGSVDQHLKENAVCIESRHTSPLIHDPIVQNEMRQITPDMYHRHNPFPIRMIAQQKRLNLPLFPTTTIGSFPQTTEVRTARLKYKKGEWSEKEYTDFIHKEIEATVRFQERVGLDVLVHGESERNDMVEFFGENLNGYVFSENGWVQSYGSRCVKPPIIYGDISRPKPMTVTISAYAQSLTKKPMKGMLSGPVTMLQWSFVRDDQPRAVTTLQIALALRKEVCDLEAAGLPVIQIDEPAIREGLPLREKDHQIYLDWAVKAFKLTASGVQDDTQIHSHFCYSDFNQIFQSLCDLDADCITIENSKSDLKLLSVFQGNICTPCSPLVSVGYPRYIGPGLYDIHSPRVPSSEEIEDRLKALTSYIDKTLLWVNPDCGLKTRGWKETELALQNMCDVAKQFRTLVSDKKLP